MLNRTADAQRAQRLRRWRQAGDVAPANDAPRIWRDSMPLMMPNSVKSCAAPFGPMMAERLAFLRAEGRNAFRNDDGAEAFGDLLKRKN